MRQKAAAVSLLMVVLAGCATLPNGPSVAVMPAPGKPFEQFMGEDTLCRQYAQNSLGGASAESAAENSEMKSIAVGTALGTAAGLLSNGQKGAGQGAAIGMMGGAAMGANASEYSGRELQRRYDIAYEQCMYAKGNQLPNGAVYRPAVIMQPAYVAPAPQQYAPQPQYAPPPPPPPAH